jgi:hypothetical protein
VRPWLLVRDRQTCVGCGKKSPETETNYTLISAQFGWRLTRFKSPEGNLVVEWRCPTCWREYKRTRPVPPGSEPLGRPPSASATGQPSSRPSAPPPRPSGPQPLPPLPAFGATEPGPNRSPLPQRPGPPQPARAPTTLPSTPVAPPTGPLTGRPGRPPR